MTTVIIVLSVLVLCLICIVGELRERVDRNREHQRSCHMRVWEEVRGNQVRMRQIEEKQAEMDATYSTRDRNSDHNWKYLRGTIG